MDKEIEAKLLREKLTEIKAEKRFFKITTTITLIVLCLSSFFTWGQISQINERLDTMKDCIVYLDEKKPPDYKETDYSSTFNKIYQRLYRLEVNMNNLYGSP